MGRILTWERQHQIEEAHARDPGALGPQLGMLYIEGHLPVETLAQLLAVALPTIYRWMYGEAHPRDLDKIKKLKKLLALLERARDAGEFPIEGESLEDRAKLLVRIVLQYREVKSHA